MTTLTCTPRGVIVPLLTPFDESEHIDEDALRHLVRFLIEARVHGLFPGGTTGEGPLLSDDERRLVVRVVIEEARGRVPVIAQVGAISTHETIAMARYVSEVGADAVAVVTPYYYSLDHAALLEHYVRVCKAIPDVAVYLYNIPQRTGNTLTPQVVAEIAERCTNVVGLKESSGSLSQVIDTVAMCPRLHVIQGSDGLLLPALTMGIQASVSGNANMFPELFVKLFDAFWQGDLRAARMAQEQINVIRRVLKDGTDLSLFKAILTKRGIAFGCVRPPLRNAPATVVEACAEALEAAGIGVR